jgi:hypothetical protein
MDDEDVVEGDTSRFTDNGEPEAHDLDDGDDKDKVEFEDEYLLVENRDPRLSPIYVGALEDSDGMFDLPAPSVLDSVPDGAADVSPGAADVSPGAADVSFQPEPVPVLQDSVVDGQPSPAAATAAGGAQRRSDLTAAAPAPGAKPAITEV